MHFKSAVSCATFLHRSPPKFRRNRSHDVLRVGYRGLVQIGPKKQQRGSMVRPNIGGA